MYQIPINQKKFFRNWLINYKRNVSTQSKDEFGIILKNEIEWIKERLYD